VVVRVRRGICMGAFAVAAALPVAWAIAPRGFANRNRRLMAHATMAAALVGTTGMLAGWGYWRNWKALDPRYDAAGWGLILIPLGIAAIVVARRRDAATAGHCPACDYDLTGNLSGVCPECGAAASALPPAAPSAVG
jgi:hypothetical protein